MVVRTLRVCPCFSVRGIPYAPASGINLIFVGEGLPLPFCRAIRLYKTILCPLHNLFPYPLFLCRCRRKEKAIKKKRHANIPAANILTLLPAAGARKRGLFIKSPLLTPSKIFTRHMPDFRCVHPTDSESPAAGGRRWCTQSNASACKPHRRRPPFKSRKNFSATGAGDSARSATIAGILNVIPRLYPPWRSGLPFPAPPRL